MTVRSWQEISASKRKEISDSIPSEWLIPAHLLPADSQDDVTTFPSQSGWFTAEELDITGSSASQILEKTTTGAWTAEAVARAFCKRAAAAHQLVSSGHSDHSE